MSEQLCAYCDVTAVWTIYCKSICENPLCKELAFADYNPAAHRTPSSCRGG